MTSTVKYSIAISIQVSGQLGLFGYAQDKSTSENRDIHTCKLQSYVCTPLQNVSTNTKIS